MNAYQMYRQTQAQTANPGELVVMLYRGAVRFVSNGIEGIEARDVAAAHTNLVKAQAIISELLQTLDVERGGDWARRLSSIYRYLLQRLLDANIRKDAAPAREVLGHLRELLAAWEQAVRMQTGAAGGARQLVAAGA